MSSTKIAVSTIREKDMKSTYEWFYDRKDSFYKLGWIYFQQQSDLETVFHETIVKIYDEKHPKQGKEFEPWVTSIFISICRNRVSQKTEQASSRTTELEDEIFRELDQLQIEYKEAIAFVYLKELTIQEVAHILQVPADTVKNRLLEGIRVLRKKLNSQHFARSCKNYERKFIDYLGKTLEREEKVDLEIHLHSCIDCQRELSSIQDTIFTLTEAGENVRMPSNFMENIENKLEETKRKRLRSRKKKNIWGMSVAAFFVLMICTGFVTNSYANMYYSWIGWTESEDEQLIAYWKKGLGEPLNLVKENNGVKITIKSAIADDIQTLIYYEIEDTTNDRQYTMNMYDGVMVENEFEVLDRSVQERYYPPIFQKNTQDDDEPNVFKGKISLLPIEEDEATIELKITRLQQMFDSIESASTIPYEEIQFLEGDWTFDIPVKKHEAIVHDLDQEIEVDGIPITLTKLTLAPTATLLDYQFENFQQNRHINTILFKEIRANDRTAKAEVYSMNWLQASFEAIYPYEPDHVEIQFHALDYYQEDRATIKIQDKELPQTFEYGGSDISIDRITIGNPTQIELTYGLSEEREFESLNIFLLPENEKDPISIGGSSEGVLIDREGNQYDIEDYVYNYETVEQPRYFETKHVMEIYDNASDQAIPKNLEIQGYMSSTYLDNIVEISLD